ncbi:unnamed protein product [Ixodes pacificus]
MPNMHASMPAHNTSSLGAVAHCRTPSVRLLCPGVSPATVHWADPCHVSFYCGSPKHLRGCVSPASFLSSACNVLLAPKPDSSGSSHLEHSTPSSRVGVLLHAPVRLPPLLRKRCHLLEAGRLQLDGDRPVVAYVHLHERSELAVLDQLLAVLRPHPAEELGVEVPRPVAVHRQVEVRLVALEGALKRELAHTKHLEAELARRAPPALAVVAVEELQVEYLADNVVDVAIGVVAVDANEHTQATADRAHQAAVHVYSGGADPLDDCTHRGSGLGGGSGDCGPQSVSDSGEPRSCRKAGGSPVP